MMYFHTILPYVQKTRSNLKLEKDYPALVIFDQFKDQTTTKFLQTLEEHNIYVVEIPGNCTDRLQPLDVAVNKPLKDHMRRSFQQWYADEVCKMYQGGGDDIKPIDLRLSFLG